MPSQFENPMMISLFENNNVCHDYFSHSERLCMLIRGGWRVANGEWGRRTDYSPFAIGKAVGTKPAGAGDALGRSAAMPDCPLSRGLSRDWGDGAGGGRAVFFSLTGGSCMGWILRLVETGRDTTADGVDLIEIDRPTGLAEIANLGLTLPEAKQVLARMQRALVAAQADDHAVQRPGCSSCNGICHIKDWRPHQIATLFGGVTVRLPRWLCTGCRGIETGMRWPSHCRSTPELDQLQAHLSALMSYRVAAGMLGHLLPVEASTSPETFRHHTLKIGEQLRDAALAKPATAEPAISISLDYTFIRSRHDGERHLEVRVGNAGTP